MDRVLSGADERRAHPRSKRTATPWYAAVLVRPGREARLLDISDGGVLIEIESPLGPGMRIQLQLSAQYARLRMAGCVTRCYVASVTADAGVRYHGAIAFDVPLSLMPESAFGPAPAGSSGYLVPTVGTPDTRTRGYPLPAALVGDRR